MDADEVFDEMATDLAPRGVLTGAMFGSRTLTLEGTAFACVKGGRFAVKLGAGTSSHAAALELGELFDPSGKGRPFKDWVAIAPVHLDAAPRFVEAGLERLAGA